MYKILLVEDNPELQKGIDCVLRDLTSLTIAGSLAEAKSYLETSSFHLVLLDVELPDGEGFKLCSQIQQDSRHKKTDVVFLTGRDDIGDKLLAFSLGADDYLLKPFNSQELRARILSRIAKCRSKEEAGSELRRGDLRLCLKTQRAFVVGDVDKQSVLDLTGLEFKLLLYFVNHEDHVLTRNQIMNSVWGDGIYIADRTVDSHVSKLRKKISISQCDISSVHGEGYRFNFSASGAKSRAA